MIAVILAGGHGECIRLGDDYVPKVLRPVSGRPLLEHQLDWLKRTGFDSVTLCLGYGADAVRGRFGDGSSSGIKLRYSVEEAPRGTAAAVKALGPASLPENVLVLYGDHFPDIDGRALVGAHFRHEGLATIVLHDCEHDSGCDPVEMGPSRLIVDFPSRLSAKKPRWAIVPIWIIRRPLFHFIHDGAPCDFVKDVFPGALRAGESLIGYPLGEERVLIASARAPPKHTKPLPRTAPKKKSR